VIPNLIPKVRLEIAVNDAYLDITVDTIINAARTNSKGEVGDGKIFITPLEDCIRIRTGERGGKAI
jgi:nitrogen regulatory protein P-II 1